MSLSFETSEYFTEIICAECGMVFAVPQVWEEEKRQTGNAWYCPNGHCRAWEVYTPVTPVKLEIVKNG